VILKMADPFNNTPAAFGISELERQFDGSDREVPMRDVALADLPALVTQFNLGAIQQFEARNAEVASLTSAVEAANTLTSGLRTEVAVLTSVTLEAAALVTERNLLMAQVRSQADTITILQAKIARLLTEVSFDPRVISSDAYFDRLTGKELFMLGTSKDPTTVQIAALLNEYQANKSRVELDSLDHQNQVEHLVSQSVLTAERAKEISRDATRDEAYRTP